MAQPRIVIEKSFTYRGAPEAWSNGYHFSGTMPTNDAGWKALADAIWAHERTFVNGSVKINRAFGYDGVSPVAVYSVNYADPPNTITSGTMTSGTSIPGDVAAWVRWKTPNKTSQGKPVYLRKYFHGVNLNGTDEIWPAARTALAAYAAAMTAGGLPGGVKICGAQGAVAGVVKVPTYLTTRTLKRRGADPS